MCIYIYIYMTHDSMVPRNINSLDFSTSAVFAPFQGSPLNGTVANPLAVLHQATDSETAGEAG